MYTGLSFGSENLFSVVNRSDAVVMKLKIDGSNGSGKVKTGIYVQGSSNNAPVKNIKIEKVEIQETTNYGIEMQYAQYANIKEVKVRDVGGGTGNASGISLDNSSNNTLSNIQINNITASSSSFSFHSYGITLN